MMSVYIKKISFIILILLTLMACEKKIKTVNKIEGKSKQIKEEQVKKIKADEILSKYLVEIEAESLKNNIIGESAKRKILVYTPKDYEESKKEYPVLYYLPGYGNTYKEYLTEVFQGMIITDDLDKLFENTDKSFIVVVVDGFNKFHGSFYTNSEITGNWEDYIIKDVVSYVDKNYRTIRSNKARGIAGHSMGGTGAFNLAIKHQDIFSSLYIYAAGLFEPRVTEMAFFNKRTLKSLLRKIEKYQAMGEEKGKEELINYLTEASNFEMTFAITYSGDKNNVPYYKLPYKTIDGEANEEIKEAWENGFGNIDKKVLLYKENLKQMKGIKIEYGERDENIALKGGAIFLKKSLDKEGISSELIINEGDHSSKLRESFNERIVPFFQDIFF